MSLPGWDIDKRIRLTIPVQVEPLVDFPLLINLTAGSGVNGYDCSAVFVELGASSLKIAIEVGDTGEQCCAEIERWDDTNFCAQIWAKVTLSASANTILWLYYDSLQLDNILYVGGIGSAVGQSVWSGDFSAVYHLSQDPSTTIKDSTSNMHDMTPHGGMSLAQLVDGPSGKALSLDGSNDYLDTSAGDFSALQSSYTLEMVAKHTSTSSWSDMLRINLSGNGTPILGRYSKSNYINAGVYGDDYQSGILIDTTSFKSYGILYDGSSVKAIGNGVVDSALNTVSIIDLSSSSIYVAYTGSIYSQIIRSIRISKIARSIYWINASYLSDFDMLITYSVVALQMVMAELSQPWSIKMGSDLIQSWHDAPVRRASLYQPWANAPVLRASLVQRWESAFALRAQLIQGWNIHDLIRFELVQRWAITADLVQAALEQGWDLRDMDLVRAELVQRWASDGDGAYLRYVVDITAGGQQINPQSINIEAGRDQDVLTCELVLAREEEYLACALGVEVVVTITVQEWDGSALVSSDPEQFVFVVTAPAMSEQHGQASYTITAMSRGVLLDSPYADTVDGDLSGIISEIAGALVDDADDYLSLSWDTVDWAITSGTWIASSATPSELLKQAAAAVGAVLQSLPDGSMVVEPEYPISINQWPAATPAAILVETSECWTTGIDPGIREGYNTFAISNQGSGSGSVRLEDEEISSRVRVCRGYQVPWDGTLELTHSGGDWITIEDQGVEERTEIETVEFVSGAGSTQYPLYGVTSVRWLQQDLGSITTAEDGSLTAAVDGESLLEITYTTKCRKWQVTDAESEQLQVVIP